MFEKKKSIVKNKRTIDWEIVNTTIANKKIEKKNLAKQNLFC